MSLDSAPDRAYARAVPPQVDEEESFAAGRQALLDALQAIERRAHERAERIAREAELAARQLIADAEQEAGRITSEAQERGRQMLAEAELRAHQANLECAAHLGDLEQQLSDMRERLAAARLQLGRPIATPPVELAEPVVSDLEELRAAVDALKHPQAQASVRRR
jgi:cell division septum initiation protein DivIVA